MNLTFADHPLFHRTALRAALGAAALSAASALAVRAHLDASALVAAGALAAIASTRRPAAILTAIGALAAAVAALVPSAREPLLVVAAAALAVGVAEARLHRARVSGTRGPTSLGVTLSLLLAGAAAAALAPGLRLGAVLPGFLPQAVVAAIAGAAASLWLAAATLPLHLALTADAVAARLDELRALPLGELRPLVDRIATARSGASAALRAQRETLSGPAAAAVQGELDALALAALDLARRGAELQRAAPVAAEEELVKRCAELLAAAAGAPDGIAQASYRRAARTLEGQLEHLRQVRRGRERIAARLHEEVAQLERARFSLLLLQGANAERSGAELELLGERLRQSASGFEAEAEAAAEIAVAAASLRQRA